MYNQWLTLLIATLSHEVKPVLAIVADIVVRVFSVLKRNILRRIGPPDRWSARPSNITKSCIAVLLCMSRCQATSVVTFWTDSWVVLGTDSLRHSDTLGLIQACKLIHVRDVFFAMDGELGSGGINFDARSIAFEAMNRTGSMETRFSVFQRNLELRLTKFIEYRRTATPNSYRDWAKPINPEPIMGAVFVGFEGGRSQIIICNYMLATSNPKMFRPDRLDTQKNAAPFHFGYYSSAAGKSINDLHARTIYGMVGPEKATERLIQAAAILYPEYVRPPVAIVKIDANGPKWIPKEPDLCIEQRTTKKK